MAIYGDYSDQSPAQYRPMTGELSPEAGCYVCGIRVVDGLVTDIFVKTIATLTSTYIAPTTGYGYGYGDENPDYYVSLGLVGEIVDTAQPE